MGADLHHRALGTAWRLAAAQHGVITRRQLIDRGLSPKAIRHRLERRRLHPLHAGVYAVGRPDVTRWGRWMAAVLRCGPAAVLSHEDAGALWGIRPTRLGAIHVSVPPHVTIKNAPGIIVHRRQLAARDVTERYGIPVTSPVCTLTDLAALRDSDATEAAVSEADTLGLVAPDELRAALDAMPRRPGRASLRRLIDRRTFRLTRSKLERLFLPIARSAGAPVPLTRQWVNGFEVDFYWPELGLVVETDGLRYHRTPQQQQRDRLRDQTHTAAGLTCLRFTHYQIAFEQRHVHAILMAVIRRLTRPA